MSRACSESCHKRAVNHVTSVQWIMSQACSGSCHECAVDHFMSVQWIMSRLCSISCHEHAVACQDHEEDHEKRDKEPYRALDLSQKYLNIPGITRSYKFILHILHLNIFPSTNTCYTLCSLLNRGPIEFYLTR